MCEAGASRSIFLLRRGQTTNQMTRAVRTAQASETSKAAHQTSLLEAASSTEGNKKEKEKKINDRKTWGGGGIHRRQAHQYTLCISHLPIRFKS